MFEGLNGVKHIVERPKHGVLFGIGEAERPKSIGDAVALLFQLPALRRVHFVPVLHIVVYDLTDGIDVCLWQTVHIPRLRLINGRNEVRLKELCPAVRVFQLVIDFVNRVPETHILNAVLRGVFTAFVTIGREAWLLVSKHRDVHIAILDKELAHEPSARFVLFQEEHIIEPWKVGLDVVGKVSVLGFHMKARLVHHAQVSPCLANDDFVAPCVGLQCTFDVAFYLRLPRQSDEGEQCGDDDFLVHDFIRLMFKLLHFESLMW